MDFDDYLYKYHKEGKSDFVLKCVTSESKLTFYICPANGEGETLFVECTGGNELKVHYELPANFRVIQSE